MIVAFHIHNNSVNNIDFKNIEDGNPGIGGSLNSHILIPTMLQKRGYIKCILLCNKYGSFCEGIESVVVGGPRGALDYCEAHKEINVLVLNPGWINIADLSLYPTLRIVLWSHNFINFSQLKRLEKMDNVLRIVNVGKEYNDLYRDMPIFNKSTYIFNGFNLSAIESYQKDMPPFDSRPNHIVYIGSLIPVKGFHILAKAWGEIKQSVADAELYVIGAGNLYNSSTKLGKWGIAEEKYEKEFMPYLVENSKIRRDVHFLGIMGPEKYNVFKHCRVGVANPSGKSETFGNGAVEMQLMGCNVTTMRCCGYLDSVYNKDNLFTNPKFLASYVISLLKRESNYYEEVLQYIDQNFSLNNVVDQWEKLLMSDLSIPVVSELLTSDDSNYHKKRLKEFIRTNVPLFIRRYFIPIEWFYPSPFIKMKFYIKKSMKLLFFN